MEAVFARIDSLNPSQQLTLKVASVIGRIFAFRVLQAIHPIEADKSALPDYMAALTRLSLTMVESEAVLRRISGTVPLAEMFGYSTAVRSLSQGRASFTLEPAGFRDVPPEDLAARGLQ